MDIIGFVGGTGPHGRGLAARLANAGFEVRLGSRSLERAEETVAELAHADAASIVGVANADAAADGDVVVITVPYEAQASTIEPLADALAGKVVISCANPLVFDDAGPRPIDVPDGSAAEEIARLAPDAYVVGAFQNVSAAKLADLDQEVVSDVLLCGDDADTKHRVGQLVRSVSKLRPIDAGPLRLSGPVEDLTAVLLSVNRRYKARAGLVLEGVSA